MVLSKLMLAFKIAKSLDISSLRDLWDLVRKEGFPEIAEYIASKHINSIRKRLTADLGRPPTDEEIDIAVSGFIGVIEGLT